MEQELLKNEAGLWEDVHTLWDAPSFLSALFTASERIWLKSLKDPGKDSERENIVRDTTVLYASVY